MEKNNNYLERYKKTLLAIIYNELPNCKVYLFGSRATGDESSGSDIDLAIDAGEKLGFRVISSLKGEIEETNIPLEVDVVEVPDDVKKLAKERQKARKNKDLLNRGVKWDEAPSDIPLMKKCLKLKLKQHPDLKNKLVASGNATIIEDCTTHDRESARFWGAVKKDGKWIGENVFGKLWMELRKELVYEQNKLTGTK